MRFEDGNKEEIGGWDEEEYEFRELELPIGENLIGIYGKIRTNGASSWIATLGFKAVKIC